MTKSRLRRAKVEGVLQRASNLVCVQPAGKASGGRLLVSMRKCFFRGFFK